MSKAWAGGSTRRWRKLRAGVLGANQRDNQGRCTLQIVGVCEGQANQVHHTLGRGTTGDDPHHLAAVCGKCNRHVGQPERDNPQPRPVSSW